MTCWTYWHSLNTNLPQTMEERKVFPNLHKRLLFGNWFTRIWDHWNGSSDLHKAKNAFDAQIWSCAIYHQWSHRPSPIRSDSILIWSSIYLAQLPWTPPRSAAARVQPHTSATLRIVMDLQWRPGVKCKWFFMVLVMTLLGPKGHNISCNCTIGSVEMYTIIL